MILLKVTIHWGWHFVSIPPLEKEVARNRAGGFKIQIPRPTGTHSAKYLRASFPLKKGE